MTDPKSNWQLLLMADDGRVIPFRHVRGFALTLLALIAILFFACAVLGWQLVSVTKRHRQALTQLVDANRQVAHYKSELESNTTVVEPAEAITEKTASPTVREIEPKANTTVGPMDDEKQDFATKENIKEKEESGPSETFLPEKSQSVTGSHRVQEKKDAYDANRTTVDVAANPTASLEPYPTETGPKTGRLYVNTEPSEARVRIINIGPKFYQGLELGPGDYHLEVSAPDHDKQTRWVNLSAGEDKRISFRLPTTKTTPLPAATVAPASAQPTETENLTAAADKPVPEKQDSEEPHPKKPSSSKELYESSKKKIGDVDYEGARSGFEKLIATYPKSSFADNAQYWIGECYYREKSYEKAIVEYQKVIEEYPSGNKVPSAMLMQGISYIKIGKTDSARQLFDQLISEYPQTDEAKNAGKRLKSL